MGFESKTTKFRSDARTDWAIKSLVQLTLFHGHWWLTGHQGKVGDHPMFQSTTSTRSQIFRHLFATLHVRRLSHIFNRIVCIYQAATWWESPSYRITIWLIDDVKLIFVCLLFVLILGFLLQLFDTGDQWTQTHIGYHPCITSEPTNQALKKD